MTTNSEFARQTAKKFADKAVEILGGVGVIEVGIVATMIDAELQEVREALGLLQNLPHQAPPCFCRIAWQQGHDGPCKRAAQLYERLRIK